MAIPEGVFPAVDQAVVAAQRALPNGVSGRTVKFGDDVASAPSAAGTAPAGHIRVPIALRQVVGDPRDDGPEEDGQTKDALWDGLRQVTGLLVHVMPHVNDPARGFQHVLIVESGDGVRPRLLASFDIQHTDAELLYAASASRNSTLSNTTIGLTFRPSPFSSRTKP